MSGPVWSADGGSIYFRARTREHGRGQYEISAAGGRPRILVRFDDPALSVFNAGTTVGNGRFYFSVGEIECDIYVMDLVRR